jgi:hypothetical protein
MVTMLCFLFIRLLFWEDSVVTELKVTLKHQFRAIQWTGDNYDEVCELVGVKCKTNHTDALKFNKPLTSYSIALGSYVVNKGNDLFDILTEEQLHEKYEIAYDPSYDESEIAKMIEKGTRAWANVPNNWLEKLRGLD